MKASVAMDRPNSRICYPYPENGVTTRGNDYRVLIDSVLKVNLMDIVDFCPSVIGPSGVVAKAFCIRRRIAAFDIRSWDGYSR